VRGQANVVGVAVLLAVTVLALGALTAGVGSVVESGAADANLRSAAVGLESVRPASAVGTTATKFTVTDGALSLAEREVRLFDDSGLVDTYQTRALVYELADQRVVLANGALLRAHGGGATFHRQPRVLTDPAVVDVTALSGNVSRSFEGPNTVRLVADVTHDRRRLDSGPFRVAVETRHPDRWRSFFAERASSATVRDIDDDGVPSVVARFRTPSLRVAVHRLEVRTDG
jgi:hypothetical protein